MQAFLADFGSSRHQVFELFYANARDMLMKMRPFEWRRFELVDGQVNLLNNARITANVDGADTSKNVPYAIHIGRIRGRSFLFLKAAIEVC